MNLESFKGAMSGFYTAHGDKARFLISAVISFTAPGVVKDAWDLIDKGIDLASKKKDTTAALQTALSALTPQEQNQLGMVLEELAKSEMLPVFRRLKTLTRQKAEPTQEMIQAVLNQQLKDRAVLQRLSRESVRQRIGLSQMQRSLAEVLRAQNALEETQKAQQQLLEAIFHGYPADALETSKRADEQAVYFSWLETRMGALEALLVENEETKGERLGALKATAQRWVKTKESPDGVSTAQFADILAVAEAVVKVPEESKVLVQGLASRMPEKLRKDTGLEAYLPPPAPSKPASVRPKPGAMQPNWKTLVPEMVMIPPSPSDGLVFKMGADNESGAGDEKPKHKVKLNERFEMMTAPVTQWLYQEVMGHNPSAFASGTNAQARPVEKVSWFDAVMFCNALSNKHGLDAAYEVNKEGQTIKSVKRIPNRNGYRLPTEAEWEFACRAGTKTRYWSGDSEADLKRVGWYHGNSNNGNSKETHPVDEAPPNASKKETRANPWGLFDMHGNVLEWCFDWYNENLYKTASGNKESNPRLDTEQTSGSKRVNRGGSWGSNARNCRAADRHGSTPEGVYRNLGFRLARSPLAPEHSNP